MTTEGGSSRLARLWIVASNLTMALAWTRSLLSTVALTLAIVLQMKGSIPSKMVENICRSGVAPCVKMALGVSFLEVLNAVTGVTRSKPWQVLLFSLVRLGVELLVAPLLDSCHTWPHLLTIICWSAGDAVRFFCFLVDNLRGGSRMAKAIRYTVGPVLFPMGALGEMIMVVTAALRQENWNTKVGILVAASLWPFGFYPLYTGLLRQRRKYFDAQQKDKTK